MIPSNYYTNNVNLLNLADDGPYNASDYDDFNNDDDEEDEQLQEERDRRMRARMMAMDPNSNFRHIPDHGRYQNEISEPNYYAGENDFLPSNNNNNIFNRSFNANNNNYSGITTTTTNNNNNRFFDNTNLNFRPSSRNFSEVGSIAGSLNPNNFPNHVNNFPDHINNTNASFLNNTSLLENSSNNIFNNYPYNNITNNNNNRISNSSRITELMAADAQQHQELVVKDRVGSARLPSSRNNNNSSNVNPTADRTYSRMSNNPTIDKRISPYVASLDPPGLLNSSYRPQSSTALNRPQSANHFINNNNNNNDSDIGVQKPELSEVIDFLSHHNDVVKTNAAAYLQHLCYMDDNVKVQTRVLRGIPPLLELVNHPSVEVHRAACGALRNISYGRANDDNKREIKNLGGITTLVKLVRKTSDLEILEIVTGIIWNLSSCSDIKRHIIDEGLKTLLDQIITPYSGWGRVPSQALPNDQNNNSNKPHYRSTIFRNASGVLRNVSSDGEYARKKMRECEGLIRSLAFVIGVALTNQDCDNKSVENCVCILRNLSYACQEVADPDYLNHRLLAPSVKDGQTGCFGNKSKSSSKYKNEVQRNNLMPGNDQSKWSSDMTYLWSPRILDIYLPLLKECSNPDTVEATAGAIQNLAACDWQPSVDIRLAVRQNQGLLTIITLLSYSSDRVIYSAATALRNLAIDEKNKDHIGKYATKDLTNKLPTSAEPTEFILSNDTLAAIESTLYDIIKSNSTFARIFVKEGGVERLMNITRAPPGIFDERVVRYAKQLLQKIWRYSEFHDELKRNGWKATDFIFAPNTTGSKSSAENTINRPIMNQGRNYQDNTIVYNNKNNINNNNNTLYSNNNNNSKYNANYSIGDKMTVEKQTVNDDDIALDVLQNMELNNNNNYINNNNNFNNYNNNSFNINNGNVVGTYKPNNNNKQQQPHFPTGNFIFPNNHNNNNNNNINNNINNNNNINYGNTVLGNTTFTTLPGYSNDSLQYSNYNNNNNIISNMNNSSMNNNNNIDNSNLSLNQLYTKVQPKQQRYNNNNAAINRMNIVVGGDNDLSMKSLV